MIDEAHHHSTYGGPSGYSYDQGKWATTPPNTERTKHCCSQLMFQAANSCWCTLMSGKLLTCGVRTVLLASTLSTAFHCWTSRYPRIRILGMISNMWNICDHIYDTWFIVNIKMIEHAKTLFFFHISLISCTNRTGGGWGWIVLELYELSAATFCFCQSEIIKPQDCSYLCPTCRTVVIFCFLKSYSTENDKQSISLSPLASCFLSLSYSSLQHLYISYSIIVLMLYFHIHFCLVRWIHFPRQSLSIY